MYGKDLLVRMFRNTCFGGWLDVHFVDHDPCLVHGMLLRQELVDEERHTEYQRLQFNVSDYICHFGREEFCLMTGLKFGPCNIRDLENAPTPLVQRIFPGRHTPLKLLDLKEVFEGERFFELYEEDAIRLCLVIFVEFILCGREPRNCVDTMLLALVEDTNAFNQFPWGSYCWTTTYKSLRNAAWKHIPEKLLSNPSKPSKLGNIKNKVLGAVKGVKGNDGGDEKTNQEKLPQYTLFGFIWGFKVCVLVQCFYYFIYKLIIFI